MAFYVIKSGGTATGTDDGRSATLPTGSFASRGVANYYDNLLEVLDGSAPTTNPVGGDILLVADDHSHTYSVTIAYSGAAVSGLTFISVFSVDVNNIDIPSVGAVETQSGTSADISINGRIVFDGVDIQTADQLQIAAANSNIVHRNGTVTVKGANNLFTISGDGTNVHLTNQTVHFVDQATQIIISGSGLLDWQGGALTTADTQVDSLFEAGATNAGMVANVSGVDLSVISGSGTHILAGVGNTPNVDDHIRVVLNRCRLGASLTGFVEETFASLNHSFEAYNCSSSSSAVDYQFYVNRFGGIAEDATDITRDLSEPFTESNQKVSIKVVTNSQPDVNVPFWFEIPARFAALSSASTDTMRIFLLSSDSGLTDADVWADMIYPDGTNKHIPIFLSTRVANPLKAGTALTANSDAWTGRTSETRYQIDLGTSGDVGADSVPIIRVFVAKPSITVYFDTSVDVVA